MPEERGILRPNRNLYSKPKMPTGRVTFLPDKVNFGRNALCILEFTKYSGKGPSSWAFEVMNTGSTGQSAYEQRCVSNKNNEFYNSKHCTYASLARQQHKKGIAGFYWQGCPVKVQKTFAGHPFFVEKCRIREYGKEKIPLDYTRFFSATCAKTTSFRFAFVQFAESCKNRKNLILIGKVFSGFTSILTVMESEMGGECG